MSLTWNTNKAHFRNINLSNSKQLSYNVTLYYRYLWQIIVAEVLRWNGSNFVADSARVT